MNELYQTADWKQEKHVPVIEAPETAKKGETVMVKVAVGKEIAHPNTTGHHIAWVEVYFHPEGEKFPHFLGNTLNSALQGFFCVYFQNQVHTTLKIKP